MGPARALPLICALLALISANTASAAGFSSFKDCLSETLKNGIQRLIKNETPLFHATDQELAEAFRGNTQYESLSQVFSERSLSRFRKSPEAMSIRDALIKGKNFKQWTGRLYAVGVATRNKNTLRIAIKNIKLKDADGNTELYNNQTKGGLKTGLAKVLIGIYEAAYSMAAQHRKITHLEIVADELVNEKLVQALTQMGFYSKALGRRLTDQEAHAVSVNRWFIAKTPNPYAQDSDRVEDLKHYLTLTLQATITRANENSRSVHFQFPDLLPIGDATEESTRKALTDQGYTNKQINDIFRMFSRRLTPEEELRYQKFVRTGRI